MIAIGKMLILSFEENEEDILDRVLSVIRHTSVSEIIRVEASNVIQIDKLLIDTAQYTIFKDLQEINVTNIEFRILYFLALHRGMVMTKDQIYEHVWTGEYVYDDSNITSHIRRLRVKIEDDPANPKYIQTVRGVGYKMPKAGGDSQ